VSVPWPRRSGVSSRAPLALLGGFDPIAGDVELQDDAVMDEETGTRNPQPNIAQRAIQELLQGLSAYKPRAIICLVGHPRSGNASRLHVASIEQAIEDVREQLNAHIALLYLDEIAFDSTRELGQRVLALQVAMELAGDDKARVTRTVGPNALPQLQAAGVGLRNALRQRVEQAISL